jgi:hypothetical protein
MAAYNFPDAPTVGQVAGNRMWDGALWNETGRVYEPPNDGAEYERRDGAWWKRRETVPWDAITIYGAVPQAPGVARRVHYEGMTLQDVQSSFNPLWWVSFDNGATYPAPANGFSYAGKSHATGTVGFATNGVAALTPGVLTGSVTGDGWPSIYNGTIMLKRLISNSISARTNSYVYNNTSTVLHRQIDWIGYTNSATHGVNLLVTNVAFGLTTVPIATSFMTLEWHYA